MNKAIKLTRMHPLVIKLTGYFQEGIRGFTAMNEKMEAHEDWVYLSERLKRKTYNLVESNLRRTNKLDLEKKT